MIGTTMIKKYGLLTLAFLVFSAAVYFVLDKNKVFDQPEVIIPLTKSWEKVIPNQKVPQGLVSLKS
ncbi:MAG: hypothetical protein KA188_07000, partial [Leadbetterella sp.]|nr:hypothetical protein [Leadbetterella sp.]